jgi:hypothetical protein
MAVLEPTPVKPGKIDNRAVPPEQQSRNMLPNGSVYFIAVLNLVRFTILGSKLPIPATAASQF